MDVPGVPDPGVPAPAVGACGAVAVVGACGGVVVAGGCGADGSLGRRQKLSSVASSLGEVTAFDATRAVALPTGTTAPRSAIRDPRGVERRGTVATPVGRLLSVKRVDESRPAGAGLDSERTVDLADDDFVVIPEQSVDDTDRGWGECSGSNDERLLADRPPHWD